MVNKQNKNPTFGKKPCAFRIKFFLNVLLAIVISIACSAGFVSASPTSSTAKSEVTSRDEPPVKVTLLATEIQKNGPSKLSGENFWLAIKFSVQEGWKIYGPNNKGASDATGQETSINWSLPDNKTIKKIIWPKSPTKDNYFTGNFTVLAEITTEKSKENNKDTSPQDAQETQDLDENEIGAKISWVACSKVCMPGNVFLSLDPALTNDNQVITMEEVEKILQSQGKGKSPNKNNKLLGTMGSISTPELLWAVMLAIIGGVILNLMPCVLPVLFLKIYGLLKLRDNDSRFGMRLHGLVFTAGVMLSFMALSAVLLILRAGGQELGWGFQLQSPVFVVALIFMFWILSFNMWGIFEIGTSLVGVGSTAMQKNTNLLFKTFLNGILACVVASPCAAPFMGTAVGIAVTNEWPVTLAIMAGLGFGVALPFLLICLFPSTIRFLPKPGAWMETFKQFLGFGLSLTTIWLIWVLSNQQGCDKVINVLLALFVIALGLYIWGRFSKPEGGLKQKLFGRMLGAAMVLMSISLGIEDNRENSSLLMIKTEKIETQPYSKEALEEALAEGKMVLIDFTAAWCLGCQLNKKNFLENPKVVKALKENEVVVMVADWTLQDPEVTEALAEYDRNSIPLTVFYGKDKQPVILPTLLTSSAIDDLIK